MLFVGSDPIPNALGKIIFFIIVMKGGTLPETARFSLFVTMVLAD